MNTEPASPAPRLFAGPARALVWTALLLCSQAHAVQHCRIDGRLVFQAAPCPQAAPAATAGSTSTRATLASADDAGAPKKRTIADVMREREAAIRARPTTHEPRPDGASILPERMGAL